MTKQQIFNLALMQHGKRCTVEEVKSENPPYEVQLCETYYSNAWHKVLGESDWSFLLQRIDPADCDDEPMAGWAHGFVLPYGLLRVSHHSSKPYRIIGNKFLTNEDKPEIFVIFDDFECSMVPDDICQLVALALAYELCGIIAPADNNIMQRIVQSYSWTLQPMISADATSFIRSPEEGGPIPETGGPFADFRA